MKKIDEMYGSLLTTLAQKLKENIVKNGGKIIPTEKQKNDIQYYTRFSISEVGISDRVSKDIYIKADNGMVYAFDILATDFKYSLVSILTR